MTVPSDDDVELAATLAALTSLLDEFAERIAALESTHKARPLRLGDPAPWALYTPPAAAEHPLHSDQDPLFTLDNFVAWYNLTYVGHTGTRARPIPDCWPEHPGLASEIATLAYTWHQAFTGRDANPRDAQHWHHHTRPGFAERLTSEWIHPHCHDGRHKPTGAPARPNRHRDQRASPN